MKLNNIQHIFFDLDHTLWDFDKNSGLAFDTVFRKNRILVELEKFLAAYTPVNENYWKLYQENKVTQEDLRYGRLRESFGQLGIEITDQEIDLIADDYVDHLPRYNHLLEGTQEMLDYLKPKYDLHIITNGFKEVQYKKLSNSGIAHYFKTITTSDDAGVKKPHRKIFEVALERSGASVAQSVMIGDNLEADIMGAQELGMQAILYNYYSREFPTTCRQVLKMKEITRYL